MDSKLFVEVCVHYAVFAVRLNERLRDSKVKVSENLKLSIKNQNKPNFEFWNLSEFEFVGKIESESSCSVLESEWR